MLELRYSLPESELQAIAEDVFLALWLLQDAKDASGDLTPGSMGIFMNSRIPHILEPLNAAMTKLAPFMPKPIGASGADLQPPTLPQCPNCGSHYHLACADDLDHEREDTEAALDDDRAKLWPGGYDNL